MLHDINAERAPALKQELARALDHPDVRRVAWRLSRHTPLTTPVKPPSRTAAVAALLRVAGAGAGHVELLFIKRAERARDPWSGHMAFPGGRHDATDASLAHTALRETLEELSMDVDRYGQLIGQLDDLAPQSATLPPIVIRPFVAVVPASLPYEGNHEVAAAFWVPVSRLRSAESRVEHTMLVNGVPTGFPAYAVANNTVWGLTERIVSQLLPLFDPER